MQYSGAMVQYLAFNAASRAAGRVPVMQRGLLRDVFFTDPSGIALEFCFTPNLTH
jgi:hypothetical protein